MSYERDRQAAEGLIRSLGVSCSNLGVCQVICALVLLHTREGSVHRKTELDSLVSKHFEDSDGGKVEKNLRDGRDEILRDGEEARLREMMNFLLRRKPSVSNFLDAIDDYMERNFLWPPDDGMGPDG